MRDTADFHRYITQFRNCSLAMTIEINAKLSQSRLQKISQHIRKLDYPAPLLVVDSYKKVLRKTIHVFCSKSKCGRLHCSHHDWRSTE